MDPFDCELRDGHFMPLVGLGTWQLRGDRCTSIVKRALEGGYRLIDTADAYGNHEAIRDALKSKDFRLAIATSATQELSEAILTAVKVPYRKMVYVSGGDVTKKKPDPQIFLIAIQRLGIEAARCVVFEDAPSGVQAAKSAGAKCIAVTNTVPASDLSGADLICDSLEQVDLGILREMISSS